MLFLEDGDRRTFPRCPTAQHSVCRAHSKSSLMAENLSVQSAQGPHGHSGRFPFVSPSVLSLYPSPLVGFPDSSVGKESACNAGDPSSVPGLGRSPEEGISYPLQDSWAFIVAQLVKNPPIMQETWVRFLGWEDSPGGGHGIPLIFLPG